VPIMWALMGPVLSAALLTLLNLRASRQNLGTG
jgi:hypothetical protein